MYLIPCHTVRYPQGKEAGNERADAMNWREARQTEKGRTIDDLIKNELSRSTLSRLERGLPTQLSVFAKAHLAAIEGVLLSDIEPDAADDYRTLTAQEALISTWNTLFPDIAQVA